MANKGFGAEKINLIGGGTPTVSSPSNLNLNADNVAISTNASVGGNLVVSGGINASIGIATAAGFFGPIYIEESTDDSAYYDIPFLNTTGFADNYRQLQIDAGQFQFNAYDNSLRLMGASYARDGFNIGIQSAGQTIVNPASQFIEGINFAGAGNSITYNSSSGYVTVEIAGGSGGAGVGSDTSINTTGIITAAAFNSPYYNSGVPYIGVGAGATQIEFQAPNVAITTDVTVGGAINAAGAVFSGIATGTFVGDGSGLIGLAGIGSGIQVRDSGTLVGMAQTIDFGTDLNVSNISAGILTVTNAINLAGIDTVGVSVFNHIDAAGIVTAASFDSDGSLPIISSGLHTTLNINSPTVAISTNMTVGGNLTVTGTINGSNLGGTLAPDGIDMLAQKNITFYKDNSTAFSSHNSEMYGTSFGTTIWREYSTAAGDGIRIGTKELTIETQSLYGYMAKFTSGGPVWLSWGGHTGDGNEHKQKLATSGIGVSVLYDYQTLGHMDVQNIYATGVVTATSFTGDGSGLTGVTATGSGIEVKDSGTIVGTAATVDFGNNLSVSAVSAGVVTITASGGGGYTAGIDTSGVSHFNHIHAVGVITANSFTSNSISSPGTLTIGAPHVAITTSLGIGGTVSIGSTLTLFDGELNIFKNVSSGNVVIQESSGGSLNINANDLQIKDYLGQESKAKFISNGAVELYYDDSKKFETTSKGIEVTGHTELDNVNVSGITTASFIDTNDLNVRVALAASMVNITDKFVGITTFSDSVSCAATVTANSFVGDGSGLTGVTASGTGVNIRNNGNTVGVAATLDFGTNLNVSPASAGIVTVSVASLDDTIDAHLNAGTASSGEVLSWTGTDYDWVAQSGGGGSYGDSDVDAHINVGTANTGQILSWNGTDYAWVTDQTGGGGGGGGGSSDPVGTIVAWSGSAASIPSEYQLCDGSAAATSALQAITGSNVPDLRDKFIVGADTSTGDTTYPGLSVGATGGSALATLVAHSHNVNSHSHTVDGHTHTFSDNFSGSVSGNTGNQSSNHTHTFNTSSNGSHGHTFGANTFPGEIGSAFDAMDNPQGNGGGNKTGTTNNTGSHSHGGTTAGVSNNHTHSFSGSFSGSVSGSTGSSSPGTGSASGSTNSQGTSSTNANLPPYYALCYIVKHTVTSGGGSSDKISEGNTEAEVVDTGTDGHFKVTTEGTERLRIDSAGNIRVPDTGKIGIGTDSPDCSLDVRAGGTVPAQFITTTGSSNGATVRIRKSDANLSVDDKVGAIQFAGDDGTDNYISEFAKIEATVADATSNSEEGNLKFYTSTNGSSTEKLLITSDGKVGIGTTAPSSLSRVSIQMPTAGGAGAITVKGNSVGAGNTNIVLRSIDNSGSQWSGAEFRAEGYSFKIRTTERFIFGFNGELGLGLPNTPGYSGPNYGTSGQVLKSQGIGAGVTWADASATQNFTGIVTATSFQVNSTTGDGSDRGFAQKYYITSSGSSGYRFAGPGLLNTTNNPTLYLHRGFTYIFENSTGSGHPFELRVSTNGAAYQPGGNFLTGSTSGTQILTVPMNAPNSIVYQCTIHSGMVGTINFTT